MGHNPPKPPPGFVARKVSDAHWLGQPVTLYCLNCGQGRHASSWTVYQKRGDFAFGTIQGGFWCRTCRHSSVVVVLPYDVPTPRAWINRVGVPLQDEEEQRAALIKFETLPFRIDQWDEGGTIARVLAKAADDEIAGACFEALRVSRRNCWHVTLREGLRLVDAVGMVVP